MPHISYGVGHENLVLDQLIIPLLTFFSVLISCLPDIVFYILKNIIWVQRFSKWSTLINKRHVFNSTRKLKLLMNVKIALLTAGYLQQEEHWKVFRNVKILLITTTSKHCYPMTPLYLAYDYADTIQLNSSLNDLGTEMTEKDRFLCGSCKNLIWNLGAWWTHQKWLLSSGFFRLPDEGK